MQKMEFGTEVPSGTRKFKSDESVEEIIILDGERLDGNDGETIIKQKDFNKVDEQDIEEQKVSLVENLPMSEKQKKLHEDNSKEKSNQKYSVLKPEEIADKSDSGAAVHSEEAELEKEGESKLQLVEDQPSAEDEDYYENPLLLNFMLSHYDTFPLPAPIEVEKIPPAEWMHKIKTIKDKENVRLVMESRNGACPLVAVANVLALRHVIKLPKEDTVVNSVLLSIVAHHFLSIQSREMRMPKRQRLAYVEMMSNLQTGFVVNVKFSGISNFDDLPVSILFEKLNINLFHGLVMDETFLEEISAIGQTGYNQLLQQISIMKSSKEENEVMEASKIENVLDNCPSQLTQQGLTLVTASMKDCEIALFFRKNRFSTIFKHQNRILQLVTDKEFIGESDVVWETLESDGDSKFLNSQFKIVDLHPLAIKPIILEKKHLPSYSSAEQ